MTQKQTASIAASWRDHPIGIQAEGLEVEELSFPMQSKKQRESRIKSRVGQIRLFVQLLIRAA